METFTNKFHNNHTYIKINDISKVSSSDFDGLVKDRPLQIGVYSDQLDLIDFIKKAGFVLKRKCYEVEVCREDLKNPLKSSKIEGRLARKGEIYYEKACNLIYSYYKKTYELVSPLTASLEEFKETLPCHVFYYKKEGELILAAFIENDEIAYLAGFDLDLADDFLDSLLEFSFKNHKKIFFESDTTDPLATRLRDKFEIKSDLSFDTYIKYK